MAVSAKPPPCPICKRALVASSPKPFCSARCADVDLGAWMTGAYAIPAGVSAEDDPDGVLPDPTRDDGED